VTLVQLIEIENYPEMLALRMALEWFNVQVVVHSIATSKQLIEALNRPLIKPDFAVLMCHGVADGLYLGELETEIAKTQPYNGTINASQFREFLAIDGYPIINNGCSLGTEDYAQAFLDSGATAYIGAVEDESGNASLMYLVTLFYHMIEHKRSLFEAHEHARIIDKETGMFTLYQRQI